MKLWSCPQEWPSSVIYIIAGGPSLSGVDLSALKGRHVIAVNSSVLIAPFAAFTFFGDSRWWYQNQPLLKSYKGQLVSTTTARTDDKVLYMRKVKPPPGLVTERDALTMQYTSLQGAMNLAVHLGGMKLVLCGADNGPSKDGSTHHHQPHSWPQRPDCWDLQMQNLALTVKPLRKLGIEVVNSSMKSRLPWWPKVSIEEFLTCPET